MTSEALQAIYDRIPPVVGCKRGCSDCCGIVPMNHEEAEAVPALIAKRPGGVGNTRLTPHTCGGCDYASPGGCLIYETRPFMCRLFAAVKGEPRLTCPHGAIALMPLTPQQAHELTEEYAALSLGDRP